MNLPISRIEDKMQTKIAALVKEIFSLKAKSERLFDVANLLLSQRVDAALFDNAVRQE